MSKASFIEQLGIVPERSLSEKVVTVINGLVHILLLSSPGIYLVNLLVGVLLAWIVTMPTRAASGSAWIDAIFVVVFFILYLVIDWVAAKWSLLKTVEELVNGEPVFGKLGGLQRKVFFTMLHCSKLMKYEFSGSDAELVKEFNEFDSKLTKRAFEKRFDELVERQELELPEDGDAAWETVWEKLLTYGDSNSTFKDMIDIENHGARFLIFRLLSLAAHVGRLTLLFQFVMLYIIARYALGDITLVSTINSGLFSIFILSLYVFASFSVNITELTLYGFLNKTAVPPELVVEFSEEAEKFSGVRVIAKKTVVQKGFLGQIGRYFQRVICVSFFNAIVSLPILGFACLLHWLFYGLDGVGGFQVYITLAVGSLILPTALAAGFRLFLWILENVGVFLAPIIYALLVAILPKVISYLVTGDIDLTETENVVTAAIAGLTTLIGTTIALRASKRVEAASR